MNSGIYCIENLVNGKRYIGRTSDLKSRERGHFSKLKKNKHSNKKLQYSWNKYGESNFQFKIIEYCKREECYEKEIAWITTFNSIQEGYNLTEGGSGVIEFSEYTKRKMSENHKRVWQDKKGGEHPASRKVYQYDLDGNLVTEYLSIRDAAISTNYNYDALRKCVEGKTRRYKKYQWFRDYKGEKTEPYKKFEGHWKGVKGKNNHNAVKIYQYTIYGEFIKEWDSIIDAMNYYNIGSANISACLRGISKQSGGFHWSRTFKGDKIDKIDIKRNKPVLMLNLDGDLLNEFPSAKEASKFLDKLNGGGSIGKSCKNNTVAFGYKWKFKEL